MSGHCFRLRFLFVFAVLLQVAAIEVTTTWLNNTIKGSTATLQCRWYGGSPTSLMFSTKNDTNSTDFYFKCFIGTNAPYNCTRSPIANTSRYSIDSSQPGSVSMMINDLQCSDDGTSYSCLVGEVFNYTSTSPSFLNVKVRPSVPTLSNVQTDVQENSNITATCTAVVGYPKAGQIVWKAYQNGQNVDLSSEFATSVVNVSQPGDDKCTVRTQSSVSLKVNRLHQNISLACFVINQYFKPTASETCTNQEADLCAMTEPIVVTYVATPFEILTTETEPATTATSKAGSLKTNSEDTTEIFTTITMETFPAAINDSLNTSPEYNAEQPESTSKLAPRLDNTVSNVTAVTGSNPGVTKSSTNLNTDFISMLAMGLILSAIIIIQFVVIIMAIRRSQGKGPCRRKVTERTHHTYNQPERESDYDYINDSYYKNLHLIY